MALDLNKPGEIPTRVIIISFILPEKLIYIYIVSRGGLGVPAAGIE